MKRHKIAPEIKEQIINRIKNEGVSVVQAAKDHGVNENTIYNWIAKKTEGQPSLSENIKLKRENRSALQTGRRDHPQAFRNPKKEMISHSETTKTLRARELGVSREHFLLQVARNLTKTGSSNAGSKKCCEKIHHTVRPALHLQLKRNHKPVERVMKLFGIKAYRRRGQKWKKTKSIKVIYPNMLMSIYPAYTNHIWTADFTSFVSRKDQSTSPRSWICSPEELSVWLCTPPMRCSWFCRLS